MAAICSSNNGERRRYSFPHLKACSGAWERRRWGGGGGGGGSEGSNDPPPFFGGKLYAFLI